jgi:hypothetical protein
MFTENKLALNLAATRVRHASKSEGKRMSACGRRSPHIVIKIREEINAANIVKLYVGDRDTLEATSWMSLAPLPLPWGQRT